MALLDLILVGLIALSFGVGIIAALGR